MAKEKRNFIDDIIEGGRRLIKELDEMMNPHKKQQKQRVPIPVRPNRRRNPYNKRR